MNPSVSGSFFETDICHNTKLQEKAVPAQFLRQVWNKLRLWSFSLIVIENIEGDWVPSMWRKKENRYTQLTPLTHGASSSSRTLATELFTLVFTGAPVEAGVGAAGILGLVVRLDPNRRHGGGWRRSASGDSCHGGGGGGGGQRRGVCRWGRGCTSSAERPACGPWRAAGDVGGSWPRPDIGGSGGRSSCRDWRCGDSCSGEEGDRREAC